MNSIIQVSFFVSVLFCTKNVQSQNPMAHDSSFQRENISFYSNGIALKGWLYMPSDTVNKKIPALVMAPGVSGVKECNYDRYAEKFAKEGFAVILFDYPNFGESGGNIRQEIDPWAQVQSYRDAISFATTDKRINAEKIGVWGGSYSGGHAIVVSSLD